MDIASESNGLQKGVGAINQIYVLYFMINRRVVGKKGKVVMLFVDYEGGI